MPTPLASLEDRSQFQARHIGPDGVDETLMCAAIGVASRQALMDAVVPAGIRRAAAMQLPAPVGEAEGLAELRAIAAKNRVLKSFIGQGYHGTHHARRHPAQHPREPGLVHRSTRPTRPRSPRAAWRRC
jgi:glycine dehydrogenase